MNNLLEIKDYREYKEALDKQMMESAEGFVRIGYLLKLAKDTDILQESGYANVNDFAKAEYGIDKTLVSRFISINDRFSEGGNSQVLKTKYQGFGYAKLVIMLQLPDSLNEELTKDYSKREIQALKDEVDEEKKISDLEVLAEGTNEEMTELDQAILKICEENPETYLNIHKAFTEGTIDHDNIIGLFAPAGEIIYSVRIQGVGRVAYSFKEGENTVSSINLRSSEKNVYTLNDIILAVRNTLYTTETDTKTAWQQLYGREFPIEEKKEIAPVQHKSEKKPKAQKPAKVVKAKEEPKQEELHTIEESIPVPDPAEEPQEENKQESIEQKSDNTEEQLEGQKNIEDYPEAMPDEVEKVEGIVDSPDFEAEMAAVEESEFDIRNNIVAGALNIVNTLQSNSDKDRISQDILSRLISISESIKNNLKRLKERLE